MSAADLSAGRSLVYVGDPLCSWCYGFAVPLAAVLDDLPGCRVDLVMGGLRAFNTEVMAAPLKESLRHHWSEVHRRSGQPFHADAILARDDFVYDTEPACRAVVTVRAHASEHALAMFHAIQHAFYAQGRDVTQPVVLTQVWESLHATLSSPPALDAAAFAEAFASDAMQAATREDFALARSWGIAGFPTLLAVADGQGQVVARGYADAATLRQNIQQAFTRT